MSARDQGSRSPNERREPLEGCFAVGAPAAQVHLEDWVVGALLSGYGDRARRLPSSAFVRHGYLVDAFQWLVENGGVRREYVIRDRRVVLTIRRLREALNQIGAPAVDRHIEVAEKLMGELPIATPPEVSYLEEQRQRRQMREAVAELQRRLAEGARLADVADEVRMLLGGMV